MKRKFLLLLGLGTACGLAAALTFGALVTQATDTPTSSTTDVEAAAAMNPLLVLEQNKDANGLIRVHEQGTVPVTGTINVGNMPDVQNVSVQNTPLPVTGSVEVTNLPAPTTGTTLIFDEEFSPFDSDRTFTVDIHQYSKIRIAVLVNGSGTVQFFFSTDAGLHVSFDDDAGGGSRTVFLGEVAGTELLVLLRDPDGEQVFVSVFGSN